MLDNGAYMPTRAHGKDAGLDLYAREAGVVLAKGCAQFDTGVHVQLPPGTAGLLVSKSGLNTKHGITSTGLIDEGYTGSIRVKLYNHSSDDYHIRAGDKISQLMIVNVEKPELELVESLEETERGAGGFGSTGR
jgi:dUTP pyrophosphatase